MPQGEETFLYRIVTQLDDQQAFNQVSQELSIIGDATEQARGSIQNMTRELQKMLPKSNVDQVQKQLSSLKGPTDISGLKSMRSQLEALEKNLDNGSQASQRLNKVIEGVDSANFTLLSQNVEQLKKDLQGVEPSFQDLQEQLQRVEQSDSVSQLRKRFTSLQAMIRENEDAVARLKEEGNFTAFQQRVARIESQLQDTKNTVAAAGGAIEKRLGTSLSGVNTRMDTTRLKTNQMSQAILQGAQDAQFGVIGVANNIQMLGESISRQMSKGVSVFRVMGATVRNLLLGPMAIGTLITTVTLLAQNLDKLPKSIQNFGRAAGKWFGFVDTKMEKIAKNAEKAVGEMTEVTEQDVIKALGEQIDTEGGGPGLSIISNRLAEVTKNLQEYRQASAALQREGFGGAGGGVVSADDPRSMQAMATATNATVGEIKSLSEEAKPGNKAMRRLKEIQAEASENMTKFGLKTERSAKELKELKKQADLSAQEVKSLQNQQELLQGILEAANAESIRHIKARKTIKNLTKAEGEELKTLTNLYVKAQKERKKANNEREREVELRKLRADILSGVPGEIAQVQANLATKLSETDDPMIKRLLRMRARGKRQEVIRSWWTSTMEEFVQQGQAMKFDLGPGFQDVFLPFGGNKGKMKKKAKDQMQIAQEAFRAEQERLRGQQELLDQRSELGPQADSLFGLGVANMENKADERLQFQMRIAREEKNIQKQRLQNQQQFLGEKFEQGKISWPKFKSQTRNIQQKIYNTEQQWYRKREKLQDDHVKNKIKKAGEFGQEFLGQTSSFASTWFNTWKNEREQELKQQGKTEEERRKILKEEGQKRFQFMKNVKIAEASADTIAGVAKTIGNYPFPYWIPLAAAHAAAGAARVNKIAQLSIGDKIGGGGGVGGGASSSMPSAEFGQLTPDENAARANNLASANRRSQASQQRTEADKMESAAQRIDRAANKIQKTEVTYDDKTAEDITERGNQRQESLNI